MFARLHGRILAALALALSARRRPAAPAARPQCRSAAPPPGPAVHPASG